VLRGRGHQFLGEGVRAPGLHLVQVRGAEFHHELVGHHGALAGDRGGAVVHLAADRAGDLHGLDLAAEGLGEGAAHHAFDALLEAVEDPHLRTSFWASSSGRSGCGRGDSATQRNGRFLIVTIAREFADERARRSHSASC